MKNAKKFIVFRVLWQCENSHGACTRAPKSRIGRAKGHPKLSPKMSPKKHQKGYRFVIDFYHFFTRILASKTYGKSIPKSISNLIIFFINLQWILLTFRINLGAKMHSKIREYCKNRWKCMPKHWNLSAHPDNKPQLRSAPSLKRNMYWTPRINPLPQGGGG